MLFPFIITIALSIASPAFAWNDDYNNPGGYYGGSSTPSYGASSSDDSGFSAMQRTWQREAAEAEQRNKEATERRNQPPTYLGPSWVNPTPSFGVYGPNNSMQLCRQSGNSIYCF